MKILNKSPVVTKNLKYFFILSSQLANINTKNKNQLKYILVFPTQTPLSQ